MRPQIAAEPLPRCDRSAASLVHRQQGFTLIEIAVAVFLITLVLGSVLGPLAAQVEQRQSTETEKRIEEIKEALIGFAAVNGYLPCPARSAIDGTEDRTAGVCTAGKRVGFLPWVTLGVSATDPWGDLFRYSVVPAFADATTVFGLTTARDILITGRDTAGAAINLTNAGPDGVPAVVLSHGKNGYGATGEGGFVRATPGGWAGDEQINATNATNFFSRVRTTRTAAPGGEFDDIVIWISPNVLFARMIAAGRF
jgi:prepilin-type N-terminal cleavage/methylation domain-containing protein